MNLIEIPENPTTGKKEKSKVKIPLVPFLIDDTMAYIGIFSMACGVFSGIFLYQILGTFTAIMGGTVPIILGIIYIYKFLWKKPAKYTDYYFTEKIEGSTIRRQRKRR